MKVITICGSMRFEKQMIEIAKDLEFKGYCVIQCVYNLKKTQLNQNQLLQLKNAHYKKIDISDAIYVVNIGGYIGEACKSEIEYAKSLNKQIIYHEN